MTEPSPKTRRVLVVEDNEATAELEKRALQKSGLTVSVATDVETALELLARESFLAVLLDYNLPGGDPWLFDCRDGTDKLRLSA